MKIHREKRWSMTVVVGFNFVFRITNTVKDNLKQNIDFSKPKSLTYQSFTDKYNIFFLRKLTPKENKGLTYLFCLPKFQ